ncbi:large ribosomal subunit protein uL10m isoform X2 [Ambystoma mexicanum]
MHFERQKLMALTRYIAPKPAVPERCIVPRKKPFENEESPLAKILCRQLEEVFQKNKMIAVFQNCAIGSDEMLRFRHRLLKHNIHIKFFPNEIIRRILPSSPYRNLLPLFIGQTLLVVSQEVKAKEMLSVVRSIPHVQLLGACIENTLLSKQGVINCSKLPSIALLQGEVVGGLTLMTSQTCALIQRDSMELVCLLQQYIKQQSDPPMGTSDEGQTETPPSQGTN